MVLAAQGNLKYAGQATVPLPSFETLIDLRSTNLHKQLEQYCQQQLFQTLSFITPKLVQPGLLDLRSIQVRVVSNQLASLVAHSPALPLIDPKWCFFMIDLMSRD
jgi:hypothetical protein